MFAAIVTQLVTQLSPLRVRPNEPRQTHGGRAGRSLPKEFALGPPRRPRALVSSGPNHPAVSGYLDLTPCMVPRLPLREQANSVASRLDHSSSYLQTLNGIVPRQCPSFAYETARTDTALFACQRAGDTTGQLFADGAADFTRGDGLYAVSAIGRASACPG